MGVCADKFWDSLDIRGLGEKAEGVVHAGVALLKGIVVPLSRPWRQQGRSSSAWRRLQGYHGLLAHHTDSETVVLDVLVDERGGRCSSRWRTGDRRSGFAQTEDRVTSLCLRLLGLFLKIS